MNNFIGIPTSLMSHRSDMGEGCVFISFVWEGLVLSNHSHYVISTITWQIILVWMIILL
jgi:hypothetical protein